jgi:hypothetical protein
MEVACLAIMDCIRKRKRELIIPWKLKALLALNLLSPRLAESFVTGAVDKQDR